MPGVFVMRFNNVTRKYFFVMDTKLIKNIITGGAKSFVATEAGAWYRLGYVEKNSNFYGEFLIGHSWNHQIPEFCKILVGGATSAPERPAFYIEKIFQNYPGSGAGTDAYVKNKLIKKARTVSYPIGTTNYNIYIDIFIQDTGEYIQNNNTWIYKLSTELNPWSSGFKWVDCAFGEASIPSGLVAQEFSLA